MAAAKLPFVRNMMDHCLCWQVAVFDTAYHQTMPASSYMYALPYELYEKHAIRKYGFHGTSHRYLVQQASKLLGKPESQLNLIICHIGDIRTLHMLCSALHYAYLSRLLVRKIKQYDNYSLITPSVASSLFVLTAQSTP